MFKMLTNAKSKKRKGFTLVELIVVVAILLILAVLAVMAYSNITASARRASFRYDANSIVRALNMYNGLAPAANRVTSLTGGTIAPAVAAQVAGSSHSYAAGTLTLTLNYSRC
jgi:prepilin-type N-terminal cleavage/methylation domain-containing protein